MKVLCQHCGRLEAPAGFGTEQGRPYFTCGGCGAHLFADEPGDAETADSTAAPVARQLALGASDFEVPTDRCPKCVAPRAEDAEHCPACGLCYEQFDASVLALPSSLESARDELLEHWGEPEAHDRFLQEAAAQEALIPAGHLYRVRLGLVPGDALAARGRDEVMRLALANAEGLSVRKDPQVLARRRKRVQWAVAIAAVLCSLFSAGLLLALWRLWG